MDLLDRYLKFVRSGLPAKGREDILAELSENLRSRLDDREEELGRPLTEAEVETLLDDFGHPLVVAGRYRTQSGTLTFGRELIGPELFPFYALGLKWSTGVAALAVTLVMSGLALADPSRWPQLFPALVLHLGLQFAIQTGVWVAIQAHLTRFPRSWRAHDRGEIPTGRENDAPRVSRFETALQLVLTAVFFPWIHALLWPAVVLFGPFKLGPSWHQMYVPFVVMTVVSVGQALANLVRPDWVRLRSAVSVLVTVMWIGMLWYVYQNGDWAVLADTTGDLNVTRQQLAAINHYVFYYPLLGSLIGAGVTLVIQLWCLARELRKAPAVAVA